MSFKIHVWQQLKKHHLSNMANINMQKPYQTCLESLLIKFNLALSILLKRVNLRKRSQIEILCIFTTIVDAEVDSINLIDK